MSTAPSQAAGEPSRGRASSRAARVVADSGLPAELAHVVLGVVSACRLWEHERAEVARELCGHFLDGLGAGKPPNALAEEFGDPARAAALITRARRRLRPLWWRAMRRTAHGCLALTALCLLTYSLLAARFFRGSPTIARNYMREMNAPVLAVPADQRAWPVYLRALREFAPIPEDIRALDTPRSPDDPGWERSSAWLRGHERGLELIREAAARPALGYVFSHDLDPALVEIMKINTPGYQHPPASDNDNPLVLGILLPHLGELRKMTRWLGADAAAAAPSGDRARFLADIDAMLGMSDQCLPGPYMISSLVGVAIHEFARSTVQTHALREGFLSDDDLRLLAHRLVAGPRQRPGIDIAAERIMIDDIVQRFYTDDGGGDGRFIQSPETDRLYDEWGLARPKALVLLRAYHPIQSELLPSRRALADLTDRFVARAATDEALPPWRHDERSADALYARIGESGLYTILPIIKALQGGIDAEPISSALASRDLAMARRDALLVVLALELHRRQHGEYPRALSELTPTLLPSVPLDPMDGKPLRYRCSTAWAATAWTTGARPPPPRAGATPLPPSPASRTTATPDQ
jgi:hypothetical protein